MVLASSNGSGAGFGVLFIVIVIVAIAAYFIPTIVAVLRHVPNVGSIGVLNALLGWTFIGWVVALAMAARSTPPVQQVNIYGQQPPSGPGSYRM